MHGVDSGAEFKLSMLWLEMGSHRGPLPVLTLLAGAAIRSKDAVAKTLLRGSWHRKSSRVLQRREQAVSEPTIHCTAIQDSWVNSSGIKPACHAILLLLLHHRQRGGDRGARKGEEMATEKQENGEKGRRVSTDVSIWAE